MRVLEAPYGSSAENRAVDIAVIIRSQNGPDPGPVAQCGILYPVYVRGVSYLAAHQGAEAAAEFQEILDHPGIVASDPIGAMARLQLGRAFVLSGDKTRANAACQDFLTLWQDADPDIPC